MIIVLLILTLLILTIILSIIYLEGLQDQKFYEPFIYEAESLNPEEFDEFYNHQANLTKSYTRNKYDGPGVFVFYNQTKDKYYFGQGDPVIEKIQKQMTSDPNKSLQVEINHGDQIYIKMMLLEETKYETLDELEQVTRREFLA